MNKEFSSVQARDRPSGLRAFAEVLLEPSGRDYGLAQLGHLKQPRSPACPTNNEQLWLNSSLLSSSEASRPAKLQKWLRSSAKSATRVRWRPRLLRSTCENTTSWTMSSSWHTTWPAQPSLRSRMSWVNDMGMEQRFKHTVSYDTWSCHLTPSMVRRQRDWNTKSVRYWSWKPSNYWFCRWYSQTDSSKSSVWCGTNLNTERYPDVCSSGL